ncbi:uncharacterized protein LOC131230986 isoform X2 [Magnolia sinica]|uniref:uncharacterized protein LOC131230986 isoform X2 n=1 Tax=Magnolia sinica TaxID=86752 RepID=UPI002658F7EB|nr:uncharacterized protein LOC131230986 isoform X2 [Magnolia sinica]
MEADEGDKTPNLPLPSTNAETLIPETTLDRDLDPHANAPHDALESDAPGPIPPSSFPRDIFRALEVVERDSTAIAESFTSLFSSLRLALSEVTGTSIEHMHCFNDAAGRLQESALDAATKGNRYINSCLRLNQDMKGIESLAMQLC